MERVVDRQTLRSAEQPVRSADSMQVTETTAEVRTAIESRFNLRWRPTIGPGWVRNVPSWVIDDAKSYKRRGLPMLHIWESSNYLVALGLSNRGVPGVYFSQKLP
jgi:hypothetical protein